MKKKQGKIIDNMIAKEQATHLVNQYLLKDIEFVDKKFNNFNSGYLTLRATKMLAQIEIKNIIKILKLSRNKTISELCKYYKDVFNEIEKL